MQKDVCHRRGHPSVAAGPAKRHAVGVVEESIFKLEPVEEERRLARGAVEIDVLSGGEVGLYLKERDHVRVVDPEARLVRIAHVPPFHPHRHRLGVVGRRRIVLARLLPLHVGVLEPQLHRARIARQRGDSKRDRADDRVVDVLELRQLPALRPVERLELRGKGVLHLLLPRPARAHQRVRPERDDGVVDELSGASFGIADDLGEFLCEALWTVCVDFGRQELPRHKRRDAPGLLARNVVFDGRGPRRTSRERRRQDDNADQCLLHCFYPLISVKLI